MANHLKRVTFEEDEDMCLQRKRSRHVRSDEWKITFALKLPEDDWAKKSRTHATILHVIYEAPADSQERKYFWIWELDRSDPLPIQSAIDETEFEVIKTEVEQLSSLQWNFYLGRWVDSERLISGSEECNLTRTIANAFLNDMADTVGKNAIHSLLLLIQNIVKNTRIEILIMGNSTKGTAADQPVFFEYFCSTSELHNEGSQSSGSDYLPEKQDKRRRLIPDVICNDARKEMKLIVLVMNGREEDRVKLKLQLLSHLKNQDHIWGLHINAYHAFLIRICKQGNRLKIEFCKDYPFISDSDESPAGQPEMGDFDVESFCKMACDVGKIIDAIPKY